MLSMEAAATLPGGYKVPATPRDPKQRMVRVTDAQEIAAIQHAGLKSPIGGRFNGEWWAEYHSLCQYRGLHVEIDV
jgi:hypothetical protein